MRPVAYAKSEFVKGKLKLDGVPQIKHSVVECLDSDVPLEIAALSRQMGDEVLVFPSSCVRSGPKMH
jgi:hypothetical protein